MRLAAGKARQEPGDGAQAGDVRGPDEGEETEPAGEPEAAVHGDEAVGEGIEGSVGDGVGGDDGEADEPQDDARRPAEGAHRSQPQGGGRRLEEEGSGASAGEGQGEGVEDEGAGAGEGGYDGGPPVGIIGAGGEGEQAAPAEAPAAPKEEGAEGGGRDPVLLTIRTREGGTAEPSLPSARLNERLGRELKKALG